MNYVPYKCPKCNAPVQHMELVEATRDILGIDEDGILTISSRSCPYDAGENERLECANFECDWQVNITAVQAILNIAYE